MPGIFRSPSPRRSKLISLDIAYSLILRNLILACEMGVYAAFEYAQTDAFRDMTEEESNWNPIKTELPPEPEDEVKVRVWFADNNYFDDHFDLKQRRHLIGKTLAKFAKCSKRPFCMEMPMNTVLLLEIRLSFLAGHFSRNGIKYLT